MLEDVLRIPFEGLLLRFSIVQSDTLVVTYGGTSSRHRRRHRSRHRNRHSARCPRDRVSSTDAVLNRRAESGDSRRTGVKSEATNILCHVEVAGK